MVVVLYGAVYATVVDDEPTPGVVPEALGGEYIFALENDGLSNILGGVGRGFGVRLPKKDVVLV